jgi:hypothetical protein
MRSALAPGAFAFLQSHSRLLTSLITHQFRMLSSNHFGPFASRVVKAISAAVRNDPVWRKPRVKDDEKERFYLSRRVAAACRFAMKVKRLKPDYLLA